eukprot:TRINITY_DN3247_c0_g1_i2.p1 TRINITY_DN3247_c0_g1~~TRINITY_DN3247_c0_g1_i2.p1  ORF type:complete len:285 (-),score=42.44 TRINITY_DN3247_c0_g1_i2:154-1008(-)
MPLCNVRHAPSVVLGAAYNTLGRDSSTKSHGGFFLHMASILTVVALAYYTTIFVALLPWLNLSTAAGKGHAIAFHLWVFLTLFYYFVVSNTHPGIVSPTFDPMKHLPAVVDPSRPTEPLRFCSKCDHYRPARAHHCRICKCCILKMDHHCPWINNCVGMKNQKFFVLFLIFAIIASCHALLIIMARIIFHFSKKEDSDDSPFSPMDVFCMISTFLIVAPILAGIITLLGWQIYLISKNVSTIEYYDMQRMIQEYGKVFRHSTLTFIPIASHYFMKSKRYFQSTR